MRSHCLRVDVPSLQAETDGLLSQIRVLIGQGTHLRRNIQVTLTSVRECHLILRVSYFKWVAVTEAPHRALRTALQTSQNCLREMRQEISLRHETWLEGWRDFEAAQ